MANDCSNRLLIHCDNEQLLDKIHELFYLEEDGEIRYTMMKLVPIPPDTYDKEGNPAIGFFTPRGYWGTRSNFWWPKPERRKNEFILEYYTANGPNHYWIEELVSSILKMLEDFSGNTKPKLYVKHLFDVCQIMTDGFMYWEPGLEMNYEYSTEDNLNEKVINEFKEVEEEQRKELEVFEFHLEDYLWEEPIEDDFEYRFQRYGRNMFWVD